MYALFSKGLDFDIIKNEFTWQNEHKLNEYEWMTFFFDGLEEFFEKYHIYHPIIKDMLIGFIKNRLRSKYMKIHELSAGLDLDEAKSTLELLVKQGHVIQNDRGEFSLPGKKLR